MKLSEKLYLSAKEIWDSYYEHPFIKGIGEGSLDINKFKYYMIQDYLYLLDYTKVFALGVIKSKDESNMKIFAELVHSTIGGEMNIHKTYMKRLKITEEDIKDAKQSLMNVSYTNYMLWVSQNGGLLNLAVAVLSCSWSYKMIADKVNEIPDAINHEFYGEWIKGYVSKEYDEANNKIINMVDELGENCSEDEISNLINIFINCSRYEYEFWNMAYEMKQ